MFVFKQHPLPPSPQPSGNPEKDKKALEGWNNKKTTAEQAQKTYAKTPAAIEEFKKALTTDRSTPFTAENDEALAVMLVRVYDALDVVPKEKQKAFELVKALGEGDLTITGDIVAELKAGENQPALPEGMRAVLVTFVETPHASPPAHFDVPGVVDRTPH